MIYTVTFNPSLDYLVSVEDFKLGYTNRTSSEKLLPGGKGINISIVLKNLGLENSALGFVAGFTGDEIVRKLRELGIASDFIKLDSGNSRINMKLLSVDGTEINGCGPLVEDGKVAELMEKLEQLQDGDVLFLAGSIPSSMCSDIYCQIMQRLQGRGIRIVVDAAKELLWKVLEYHPFLIKPNLQELNELFEVELFTREEVIPYGKRLQEMGAENVLISLGGEGAVLLAADGNIFQSPAPEGKVINSVGAGDSMVAGFMTGLMEKQEYEAAFYMGLATGSASAFSEEFATRERVEELLVKLNNF